MERCIIYDCDGVLVDSEWLALKSNSHYLTSLGYPISEEECAKLFIGKGTKVIQQIVLKKFDLQLTTEDFHKMHQMIFSDFENELTPLLENLLVDEEFSAHKRCIASGSHKEWIFHALKTTNQWKHFSETSIFSAQQVKNGKPAPDLFLFAAEKMGFKPKDCIVVEDSATGIEASLAAKIPVIGFLGGSHTRYSWYQQKILDYNIPIAHNPTQLKSLLIDFISK